MKFFKPVNYLGLVALALSVTTPVARAQGGYKGTFTLPFEARWAKAVLPAGDYTLSVDSISAPHLVYVKGQSQSAILLAGVPDTRAESDHSRLTLVETANGYVVQSLEIGQVGLRLDYPASKLNKAELAKNQQPARHIEVGVNRGQ